MSEAAVGLREFQRDFMAALLADGDAAAADTSSPASSLSAQPGFAVYRNTVRVACIDALQANYPTVHQLVGGAWFGNAAAIFVASHPPRSSLLAHYGEGFAGFLAGFAPARELEYLADVARLDRCWSEAHLAADAPVLDAAALAAWPPEQLAASRLVPHPAARWLSFPAMPVFTLWRRHREGLALDDELPWHGESALLVRPRDSVCWHAIGPAATAFLDASRRGASFGDALDAAEGAEPGAGLEVWLPALIATGACTRIEAVS